MKKNQNKNRLSLEQQHAEKIDHKHLGSMYINPLCNASVSISAIRNTCSESLPGTVEAIKSINKQIVENDHLQAVEEILINQAHTLENLFHHCIEKVTGSKYINQLQVYMTMALKAQDQCRKTLVSLAQIKNPRQTSFIKQQNNAINQQVNLEKIQDHKTNELLEVKPYDTMDTRTPITAISTHPSMETLAEIDRSENHRRKSH